MAKIMNPDQVQKDFFKVIKEINDKQEVILIKSTDPGEKGAIMIGENYWNAIQDRKDQGLSFPNDSVPH